MIEKKGIFFFFYVVSNSRAKSKFWVFGLENTIYTFDVKLNTYVHVSNILNIKASLIECRLIRQYQILAFAFKKKKITLHNDIFHSKLINVIHGGKYTMKYKKCQA